MKPEIKRKWLKALRSGEYKQARNKLNNGIGMCCLGVLCDLHAKETRGEWVRDGRRLYSYLGNQDELPSQVMDWAGLSSPNPNAGEHSLAVYNDGESGGVKRHDFKQIAELIKEHL